MGLGEGGVVNTIPVSPYQNNKSSPGQGSGEEGEGFNGGSEDVGRWVGLHQRPAVPAVYRSPSRTAPGTRPTSCATLVPQRPSYAPPVGLDKSMGKGGQRSVRHSRKAKNGIQLGKRHNLQSIKQFGGRKAPLNLSCIVGSSRLKTAISEPLQNARYCPSDILTTT